MGICSDAKSTRLTGSGAVFAGPARVLGISWVGNATAGTITIKDGGASGTSIAVFDTPASATTSGFIDLSDMPLRCETDAYCSIVNTTFVTVVYA